MGFEIHRSTIPLGAYKKLRESAGWVMVNDKSTQVALKNDLFSVFVKLGSETIAMGRVIGDGGIYFYIQDVVVLTEYQRQGIGRIIMTEIEDFLKSAVPMNGFVGLMVARGVENFYLRWGYGRRAENAPGMFKIIRAG